jgi:trimeric autotransporter adhesin
MTTAARRSFMLCLTAVLFGSLAAAQSTSSAQSSAVVPRLVNYSGKAIEGGKVITGVAGATFAIYSEEFDGSPLWLETQNIQADTKGNYTVQLGAMSSEGLPLDLFTSGEARWLGVRVNGGEEQPRVLLLSVPYALKAADAQTLGGLPPSAFALAGSSSASAPQSTVSTSKLGKIVASRASANTPSLSTMTGSGTKGDIPIWTSSTSLGNSAFFQTGTGTSAKVGLGTTTPGAPLDVHGIINSSARFNLGGQPFAFGSYTNENAFLGFAGNTTTTGDDNTASGAYALHSNTTGYENTASGAFALYSNTKGNENTASGLDALYRNTTGGYNTADGDGALQENTTGDDNTASGAYALNSNTTGTENTASGENALTHNTTGSNNTASGYQALTYNTTGSNNTASGYQALYNNNTTGSANTANGAYALYSNTTGVDNTASGTDALQHNTTGNYNTALGFIAGPDPSAPALNNSTAIGAFADVTESNALVLGSSAAYNGIANVLVGIDVPNPTNILTVLQGGGNAIADGWSTYSSRRWKTNIHPLDNALSKVEQLRGISYDLKDSGKHEIGVIAEEVGKVVPEVVSYEPNGKDATGVDYSRLTALLIEAVKQQQGEISALRRQLQRRAAREAELESRLARMEQDQGQTQVAAARPVQ